MLYLVKLHYSWEESSICGIFHDKLAAIELTRQLHPTLSSHEWLTVDELVADRAVRLGDARRIAFADAGADIVFYEEGLA